jgi:hypothetical protein
MVGGLGREGWGGIGGDGMEGMGGNRVMVGEV